MNFETTRGHRRMPRIPNANAEPADDPEPRWPAFVAVIAVGGLNLALPERLTFGPRWLLLVLVLVLLLPTALSRRLGHHTTNQVFGYILLGVLTAFMVGSVLLLVHFIPLHREAPQTMLRSAIALWTTNILVFASWYWRLDAGGPHARDLRAGHTEGAFLFPQMTLDPNHRAELGLSDWSPQFIDYLFLAFNTSTALSPADTAALSRWAKVLMMIQATVSLIVVALIAARAVNIL